MAPRLTFHFLRGLPEQSGPCSPDGRSSLTLEKLRTFPGPGLSCRDRSRVVHSWPCLGPFPPLAALSPVVTALPRTRAGTGFGAGAAGPGVGGAAARDPHVLLQPGPKARAELPGGVVSRAGRLVLHRGSSKLGLRHQKEASESLEGLGRAAWSRLVGTVLGRARLCPSRLAQCGQGWYLLRISKGVPQTLLGSLCSDTHQSASSACPPSKPPQPSLSLAHLFTALYAACVEGAQGSVALQPRPLSAREQWACRGSSG